jgi:methylenetetrahydrofolate--tRNA-(uracil-5-)-methyltransferase
MPTASTWASAWLQSRYDKGETEEERTAYINCPLTREQYEAFIDALLAADKTEFHEGETAGYFDGCLPVEVMAERGARRCASAR